MTTATTTIRPVGRKRRPPPKGKATIRQRFVLRLHELAGERSNKEIAAKCGASTSAVTKWFAGEQMPEIEYWPALAKSLGLRDYRDLLPPPH